MQGLTSKKDYSRLWHVCALSLSQAITCNALITLEVFWLVLIGSKDLDCGETLDAILAGQ